MTAPGTAEYASRGPLNQIQAGSLKGTHGYFETFGAAATFAWVAIALPESVT